VVIQPTLSVEFAIRFRDEIAVYRMARIMLEHSSKIKFQIGKRFNTTSGDRRL
jgi:hypothetical protein